MNTNNATPTAKKLGPVRTPQAGAASGRPIVPRGLTQEQLRFVNQISARFCGKFQEGLDAYQQTRVNAKLLAVEPAIFLEVLSCLPFAPSTTLARCQPSGEFCLVEIDQELVKAFCGEGDRTQQLGKVVPETYPEGFYALPVADTNKPGCLVLPPRVVHAVKNEERTIELVAVAIESKIPVAVYSIFLKAWAWAWREFGYKFELVGYDHDFDLLEQLIPPVTPMMVFGLEITIGTSVGKINVSMPGSIVASENMLAGKAG